MTKSSPPRTPMLERAARIPRSDLYGRDGAYLADPGLIDAANVALGLGLPLLLTGEPGCGKTDFAYVAAHALAGSNAVRNPDSEPKADADDGDDSDAADDDVRDPAQPLVCQIRSDSRARDLLYSYDALLRFTDGHHGGDEGEQRAADARHYIELQALGVALTARVRRVVLLDEIDKAPRDLPNDLLRELDRGVFEIAEIPAGKRSDNATDAQTVRDHRTGVPLRRVMRRPRGAPMPLVVITSNVERQLPDPFLRRCVFYHIPFPDRTRLLRIVASRFPDRDKTIADRAVDVFLSTRELDDLVKKPSTAELLDWVAGLAMFEPDDVRMRLASFHDALGERGVVQRDDLRWTDLPAIGCLFKLREDRAVARNAHIGPSRTGGAATPDAPEGSPA